MVSVAELCGCRRLVAVAAMVLCVLSCVLGRTTATAPGVDMTPPVVAHFPFDNNIGNSQGSGISLSVDGPTFNSESMQFGDGCFAVNTNNLASVMGLSFVNAGQCVNSVSMAVWVYVTGTSATTIFELEGTAMKWSLVNIGGSLVQQLQMSLCKGASGQGGCTTIEQNGTPQSFGANAWNHILFSLDCDCTSTDPECMWTFYTNGQGSAGIKIDDYVYWSNSAEEYGYLGWDESTGEEDGLVDEFWIFYDSTGATSMDYAGQAQSLQVNNTYPCSPGYWVSDVIHSICKPTSPATYNPSFGQVQSTLCPVGYISATAATSIADCTSCGSSGGGAPLPTCCANGVSDFGQLQSNLAQATLNNAGDILCIASSLLTYYAAFQAGTTVAGAFEFGVKVACGDFHMTDLLQDIIDLAEAAQDLVEYSNSASPTELQQQFCITPTAESMALTSQRSAYHNLTASLPRLQPVHMPLYYRQLLTTCARHDDAPHAVKLLEEQMKKTGMLPEPTQPLTPEQVKESSH